MSGRAWVAMGVGAFALAVALGGCGDDGETHYGDSVIVKQLNLKKTGGAYAINGDPFCEVSSNLLNNADEVANAADRDKLGLVIASAAGNAGVRAVPPFAPDCGKKAEKKLKKLDPKPKEEK